jgi:hypothetical protein
MLFLTSVKLNCYNFSFQDDDKIDSNFFAASDAAVNSSVKLPAPYSDTFRTLLVIDYKACCSFFTPDYSTSSYTPIRTLFFVAISFFSFISYWYYKKIPLYL